jgi:hypothetical protein
MDPKMIEINNLRVLNDYLNQTIEVLLRAQRFGTASFTPGLSHTPYVASSIFGTVPAAIDATYAGLAHTPYAAAANSALFGVPVTATPFAASAYPTVVDAFNAQRGLSHTTALAAAAANGWSWQAAEIARQSQITQAIAARQTALEAMCRAAGLPV